MCVHVCVFMETTVPIFFNYSKLFEIYIYIPSVD